MSVIWLIAAVVFLVIEGLTYQLVSIWFAGGSIAALIAVFLFPDLSVTYQLAICTGVSFVLFLVTRPFVKKMIKFKTEPTNTDSLIGKQAVVTDKIDNLNSSGAAKIDGKVWTARSTDNTVIPENSVVTVERIDGVKLIVRSDS